MKSRVGVRVAALCACALAASAPVVAAESPLACSLTVRALKGDSGIKKSGGGGGNSRSGSSTTTSVITRNLKWSVEVLFRNKKPEKPVLKVWYVGFGDGGKTMMEIGDGTHPLTVDEKNRAEIELKSPTTTLVKRKTNSSGNTTSASRSSATGQRVTGCVIQVFEGDTLLKGWASDSRWSRIAGKPGFSVEKLIPNKPKVGTR